jgi:hypothetical protein
MRLFATFAFATLLAVPSFAQNGSAAAPDVLGTWDATFNTQQGAIPAQIKLKKDGGKLVGTIASQMGEAPLEAEVKDKTLSVWFNFNGQNGPVAIEMLGTIDGDKIKGTMTAAGAVAGDWSATRAKDPAAPSTSSTPPTQSAPSAPSTSPANLTGDWIATVDLSSMTATPAITLKQDGEKLTGEYVSAQYGKYAITGTVKGSDVTFWFAMSIEGSALNVTYTGTIEKDGSLKGSVNYGDMMSGTFVASKKK